MSSIITIPQPQTQTQPAIAFTLESTSVLLATLVSFSILLTGCIRVINNFNAIDNSIKALREGLNNNTKALEEFKSLNREIIIIDKKLDIHLQDYTTRRDVVQMMLVQMNEKIDSNKTNIGLEFDKLKHEMRDLENFLQSQSSFKTRD